MGFERTDEPAQAPAGRFRRLTGYANAHAKSFSILHEGDQSRLAPLYDLLATVAYPARSQKLTIPSPALERAAHSAALLDENRRSRPNVVGVEPDGYGPGCEGIHTWCGTGPYRVLTVAPVLCLTASCLPPT
jgi:hypothetical protein